MSIVSIMLLAACGKSGLVKNEFCAISAPIYIDASDVFTEVTAKQILIHNETGEKICGW